MKDIEKPTLFYRMSTVNGDKTINQPIIKFMAVFFKTENQNYACITILI